MIINLPLGSQRSSLLGARLTVLLIVSVSCWGLFRFGYAHYQIGSLNDQGTSADLANLGQAVQRYPESARVQAQWAAALLTQANDFEESLVLAEKAAQQAVELSPNNVDFRLLLAATQSVSGDLVARESHLRTAVDLAPHYPQVRWQLANLLIRAGKLDEALAEFRQVAEAKPSLLWAAFDLLWEATNGDFNALARATGEQPRNRMALAKFLLQQNRVNEAAQVFSLIEVTARASTPETGEFVSQLMGSGYPELARRFWGETLGVSEIQSVALSNGSFETDVLPKFAHFDWQLKRSDYASPKIEAGAAHTGQRALRVDFAGRDTTKLTDEVRQLLVLQPATAYRLTCYVRTAQFKTPEGPRWVVLNQANNQLVGSTDSVSADHKDWQLLTADFTTAVQPQAYWLTLQRTPQFSYDKPTKGSLWFDDFSLEPLARTLPR
jgi:tetratricopeptide (TPR) repeat protein